jgi:hypothetical protein
MLAPAPARPSGFAMTWPGPDALLHQGLCLHGMLSGVFSKRSRFAYVLAFLGGRHDRRAVELESTGVHVRRPCLRALPRP